MSGLRHKCAIFYFYPRSPCGERREREPALSQSSAFLSTLSLRRATNERCKLRGDNGFLSTLSLRRATNIFRNLFNRRLDFYPRSPCGERPHGQKTKGHRSVFLSTLSLRRATLRVLDGSKSSIISIHALLAESDPAIDVFLAVWAIISIHALLAESDIRNTPALLGNSQFLSTLSLRRATALIRYLINTYHNFYPRSPCGERPAIDVFLAVWAVISIHALLAESDVTDAINGCNPDIISIHALLAESDFPIVPTELTTLVFLSTLSLRRATNGYPHTRQRDAISIHALLAESDKSLLTSVVSSADFYPRSPCGERRFNPLKTFIILPFLSTLSLRRATYRPTPAPVIFSHFYPRSPCGERPANALPITSPITFLSTLSLRRAT